MHLAPGGYVNHMTDPSTSDSPFTATPGGIVYDGKFLAYDATKDIYTDGTTCVVFGPAPGRVSVSTNPNTGGTYASAP
jgi:hypothetical protein